MSSFPLPIRPRSRRRLSVAGLLTVGLLAASCQERPICPNEPKLSATAYDRLKSDQVDKVDLLLAIDNSASMHDKQEILALAVPDLVAGLVNPPCLTPSGTPVQPGPAGPLASCPAGSERPFDPILDIHVGIVSSSLGAHGADTCSPKQSPSNDDHGHLVARADASGKTVPPTYQGQGFLAWDPAQKQKPPGEADLSQDSTADPNSTALLPVLTDMITGVGQEGCGFESQLESWYRFLVDPNPYATLSLDAEGRVKLDGTDEALLTQRKEFLRPDSLLGIVLLSDENDCSVRDSGQSYLALEAKTPNGQIFHLPRPRAVCETDPNDACCFSCGQTGPKDSNGNPMCPVDPTCKDAAGNLAYLSDEDDQLNLRCWDQKRRFGVDFLNPVDRYVKGLTSDTVTDRNGQIVPNPLFTDLDPAAHPGAAVRSPSMVILTGIVGVPWQDIARDPTDLKKGFKTSAELSAKDASGKTAWDIIVGDPEKNIAPEDPLMIESPKMRTGKNPVTGAPLVTSDMPLGNPINGHEYHAGDKLQYACIFPLPKPISCANGQCDGGDSPVFDPPYDKPPTEQKRAGAVPGLRMLSVLKGLGSQGVVASVCPAQTSDDKAADFGYRPAIAATLSSLTASLVRSCLPRTLSTDTSGQVSCTVIEARRKDASGACCDPGQARIEPSGPAARAAAAVKDDASVKADGYDCFCEVPQLLGKQQGEPLWACQNDPAKDPVLANGQSVDGYCYIDLTSTPAIGNPDLVSACPETEKREIRLVGKGKANPGATLFISCNVTEQTPTEACPASAE
jgi:hypothetical protein